MAIPSLIPDGQRGLIAAALAYEDAERLCMAASDRMAAKDVPFIFRPYAAEYLTHMQEDIRDMKGRSSRLAQEFAGVVEEDCVEYAVAKVGMGEVMCLADLALGNKYEIRNVPPFAMRRGIMTARICLSESFTELFPRWTGSA